MTYSEGLFLEAEAAERVGSPAARHAVHERDSRVHGAVRHRHGRHRRLRGPAAVVYAGGAAGLTRCVPEVGLAVHAGNEAWTEVRRTGVPALVPGPRAVLTSIPSACRTRTKSWYSTRRTWMPRSRRRVREQHRPEEASVVHGAVVGRLLSRAGRIRASTKMRIRPWPLLGCRAGM